MTESSAAAHPRFIERGFWPGFALACALACVLSHGLNAVPAMAGQKQPEQKLVAVRTATPPVVDGKDNEEFWAMAKPVTVMDVVAKIPITLKAAYDDQNIYVLADFPAEVARREHRTLKWNPQRNVYLDGPEREDLLILKWNMSPWPSGLTLKEDQPYKADEWFWKACRTDPSGYADDKHHVYSATPGAETITLVSKSGQIFYLDRPGDKGDPAYETPLYAGHQGDRVPKFTPRAPSGSRGDIRAKGNWNDGRWTVEFARKLDTGHGDDVQFKPGRTAHFGVSRFEIAGRDPEPNADQPLYGCGEVGEIITLSFE